jgi:hypothetical protein
MRKFLILALVFSVFAFGCGGSDDSSGGSGNGGGTGGNLPSLETVVPNPSDIDGSPVYTYVNRTKTYSVATQADINDYYDKLVADEWVCLPGVFKICSKSVAVGGGVSYGLRVYFEDDDIYFTVVVSGISALPNEEIFDSFPPVNGRVYQSGFAINFAFSKSIDKTAATVAYIRDLVGAGYDYDTVKEEYFKELGGATAFVAFDTSDPTELYITADVYINSFIPKD